MRDASGRVLSTDDYSTKNVIYKGAATWISIVHNVCLTRLVACFRPGLVHNGSGEINFFVVLVKAYLIGWRPNLVTVTVWQGLPSRWYLVCVAHQAVFGLAKRGASLEAASSFWFLPRVGPVRFGRPFRECTSKDALSR